MIANSKRAATLQRIVLRLRPKHAYQCGNHRSENVRFAVVALSSGDSPVSLSTAVGVVSGARETGLRKMDFLGGDMGASHSGTSCFVVSIVKEGNECYDMIRIGK